MNANRHRIVFNRARGLLMAVAEIACAQGKSPANSNGTAAVAPPGFSFARLRPAAFAALLACGAQLALMHTASAQVVAYKAAPASQRPTVLTAGNGVPLVNIQTPSAAGVSRNTYEQFDVQTQGVILNNSRTNVATQLGGWVQGNPWLARGTARVILNEVISATPSQLMGYVEVAGSAAQVVIANPAGVTCNGCGFINASRATLTTGTPIVSGGTLDGYRVEGGTIRVEGAGMDASRVGYTDLIARAVEVNAGIWAQTLKVAAGTNVVGADNTQATPIAGTGAAPAFAIDVAQLGGMYAGKIVLVGTEAGVGVRNAGYLGASAGEVLVTADGQLTNSGSVIAASKVGVDARAGISNTGTVYAQGDLGFATAGDITNNGGLVAAGNHATLAATGASSRISSDATSVFAAGLNADGRLGAVGNLKLTASEQVTARGQQLAGGDLTLTARSLDLADSTNSGRNVAFSATVGDIDLSRATTVAGGTLAANTTQALIHNDAQSNANQLELAAASISNVRGEIVQTGSGDTVIALSGNLDNREGRIASNSGNLSLAAQTLTNTDGRIEHAGSGTLDIITGTLAGTRGQIASNGTLALSAQSATLDAGTTLAATLAIDVGALSNRSGQIVQTGNGEGTLKATTRFDNTGGTLVSGGKATLIAGEIDNRGGGQIAASGELDLSASQLANDQGRISAGSKLEVTVAQAVGNAAGRIVAGRDLSLTAASLDNTAGTIGAVAGKLEANTTGAINNTAGRIEAAQNITLASAGLTNTDGTVVGNALSIDTRSQALANTRGRLVANATMNLQTGALTNAAGLIQAAAALTIDTHGQAFDNTAAGSTSGQAGVTVSAGAFNNAAGFLGAGGPLAVVADNLTNTASGLIVSETAANLSVRQLDNRSGQIQSTGNLAVRATDSADNTGGLLRSGQALTVDTASLANANTLGADQGIEGNALTISANSIDNRSGALRANTVLAINSSGALNNSGGLISSAQSVAIRDAAATKTLAVANTAGTIAAGQQLDIDSATLSGDGKLLSQGDLAIKLVADYTHSGELTANGRATLETAGTLINQASMQAGTSLALTAATIDNHASGEILAPELRLAATAAHTLTNRGLIDGGDTRIDAITLNNLGTGRIYGDHLSIAATTLTNAAEAVNGVTSAPVIAARDRLDLGVGTLNNREGALIFSAGDLAIGRALDASNRATGLAGTINNASGIIEALGDLRIDSSQLNNSRYSFATSQVVTSSTPVNVVLWDRGGDGNYKLTKTTNIQISETRVTTDSGAGKILAGGDLHLTGAVNNDKSEIMAGGNILLDMAGYTATSLQGQTQKSETGYTSLYYRKKCKWYEFCSYKNHRTTNSPYNDGPYTLATFDVAVAKMTANQAITGTATQISNLSVGAVNQGAAGANGVTAAVGSGSNVARISQVNTPATAGGPAGVVATVNAPGALPNNSLYHNNPNPTGHYLIETDPRFASYRQWISSDYMLAQLALDPATTQKRLGDGFYEQRLITEQIAQLTGRRFLTGYANEEAQYLALMNAGITVAQAWNLIPGVALSAEQMAQLTTDMVWLVEKEVSLADGSTQKVLTPQLYARVQPGDLDASGGLLAANSIDLDVSGDLTNMGTLAGRQLVSLTADNIKNLTGRISGEQVALAARTDLENLGGSIEADNALQATAGRNLTVASVTESHTGGNAHASLQSTAITRLASLQVKNPSGTLQLEAGGDIALLAAHLLNTAPTAAGPAGRTTLIAGNDIKLATLTESSASGLMLDGNNYRRQSETHETGSVIESSGDIRLQAGQSVSARAASVTSNEGALVVTAGKDITIESGEASQRREAASRTTKSGFLSSKTTTTRDTRSDTTALASTFSGDSTTLIADRDIAIKGSNVVATNDTMLIAGRDIAIEAATEAHSETHVLDKKKSGFLSSGLDALNKTRDAFSAKGSIVSAGRDLELIAGAANAEAAFGDDAQPNSLPGNLTIQGSALAAGRDLALQTSGDLQLLAAYSQSRETTHRTTQTRRKLETLNFDLDQTRALLATLTAGNSIDLNVGGNVAAQIGSMDSNGNLQADRMTATGVIKGSDRQQVSLTHTSDKKDTVTNGPTSKVLGNLAAQGIRSGANDSFAPEALQSGQAAVTALMQNGLLTVTNQPAIQAALNAPTPNGSALTFKDDSGRVTLTLAGEAKVQAVYNQLKLTETFDVKHFADQGTAQVVTLVAAIALTVMSGGTGAALVGATSAAGSAAANAAFIAMASTMTGQLAAGASFDEAFQVALKAGTSSAITAGILNTQMIDTAQGMQSINQLANVQTTGANIVGHFNADTLGQNLLGIGARGVVSAGVNSTIYGGSFGDAFKASVVGDLAAVGANAVGQGTNALSLGNVLGHAAVGCAAAAANGKDCASGAIGGAGAAIANPLLDQAIGGADGSGWGSNPETAQQWQTATLQLGSMGASAAAAAALGKDGMTAALAAQNETVNNFLTKENIEAKQKRLAAAKTLEERAAIVKEYIGVSTDNRNKALADVKSVMTVAELEAVKDNLTTLVSGPTACNASQACRTDVRNSISEINGILTSARAGEKMEPVVLAAEAVLTLATAGEYLVARNALRVGVAGAEALVVNGASRGVPVNGGWRTVPLGFEQEPQFLKAAQELQDALKSSGINDATVGVRGSSVTGYSLTKGTQFGPQSDIDFFVESAQLTGSYKISKNIPGFVHPNKILPDYPLLQDWATKWTNTLGRDVTPGAFIPRTLPSQPAIVVK